MDFVSWLIMGLIILKFIATVKEQDKKFESLKKPIHIVNFDHVPIQKVEIQSKSTKCIVTMNCVNKTKCLLVSWN